jgi:hypothetical protein
VWHLRRRHRRACRRRPRRRCVCGLRHRGVNVCRRRLLRHRASRRRHVVSVGRHPCDIDVGGIVVPVCVWSMSSCVLDVGSVCVVLVMSVDVVVTSSSPMWHRRRRHRRECVVDVAICVHDVWVCRWRRSLSSTSSSLCATSTCVPSYSSPPSM